MGRRERLILARRPVGVDDGIWSIRFCNVLLGLIDERGYVITCLGQKDLKAVAHAPRCPVQACGGKVLRDRASRQ